MPLLELTTTEALGNLRRATALWPSRTGGSGRLETFATVGHTPRFGISTSDRILTLGSCFARNIEHRLIERGFSLPTERVVLQADERVSGANNDILNKYTVHSMLQELEWATGERQPSHDELYLEVEDGLWHDLHLSPNMKPAPLQRIVERRAMVTSAIQELPSCDIFILTLGLAEAWFDTYTGLYLNGMPPRAALRKNPNRFTLRLLDYDEILAALQKIHSVLVQHAAPNNKLIITVSPIPFRATFTELDALAANTYSKSVQRAASEALFRQHGNVDYFPSYETVTLSTRSAVYDDDNIHVRRPTIDKIMEQFFFVYMGAPLGGARDTNVEVAKKPLRLGIYTQRLNEQANMGDFLGAALTTQAAIDNFSNIFTRDELGEWRRRLANLFAQAGYPHDAARQIEFARLIGQGVDQNASELT